MRAVRAVRATEDVHEEEKGTQGKVGKARQGKDGVRKGFMGSDNWVSVLNLSYGMKADSRAGRLYSSLVEGKAENAPLLPSCYNTAILLSCYLAILLFCYLDILLS